jgi:two-component system, chemotaxis family, CheB/CheR fusion protein
MPGKSPKKGRAAEPPPDGIPSMPVERNTSRDEDLVSDSIGVRRFPIVGIGASAGGLEALQEFFGQLPDDTGAAFVVITHLHPGHLSLLPELLGRTTRLPVAEAHDGLRVEPDHVYVATPGGLMSIQDGVLRRSDSTGFHPQDLPIDHFFRALAKDQKEHAICIILSGTGTDGTLGMRVIKGESGMAMVQEVPTARYTGMPSSAHATGLADYVLPAGKMPEQLLAYIRGPYLGSPTTCVTAPSFPTEPLQRILVLLRARTGHDFRSYKASTVRRRIERRMNVHQVKLPQDYVAYLRENPYELDLLFSELLISVTSFFRDPDAFAALGESALPALIAARPVGQDLRVWVPGCASGEEAYSIAILIREHLEKSALPTEVHVFATDLDSHAIEVARAGTYGGSIAADVSPERLKRFFVKEENLYHVRKEIREMVVFAPQNVIRDPPFTRLDLIVCRNVLIYFDADTQKRLLPAFHYALRPGGLLMLGPSETIGGQREFFETVDKKWKIYRRRDGPAILSLPLGLSPRFSEQSSASQSTLRDERPTDTTTQVHRLLSERFAPVCAVVDEHGNIVYLHGRAGNWLEPSSGQPRANLLDMAREGLGQCLLGAMRMAANDKTDVVREHVRVRTNGGWSLVDVAVSPIDGPVALHGLLLVSFRASPDTQDKAPPAHGRRQKGEPERTLELERDLQYTRESLQITVEEFETSNEELKSTNEELQSTNEELQSANEELETSKEELQSLNEELTTLNTELQSKVDQLARANDDMQNLLDSTEIATIFLDNQLNVKRYTEKARDLVRLITSDVGRPLSDLASNLNYRNMTETCQQVLRTLVPREADVRDRSGAIHVMRIMPYRTSENVIDGVVITFMGTEKASLSEPQSATGRDGDSQAPTTDTAT